MKKRTVITVLAVVGLLIIAFISGGVVAQRSNMNSKPAGSDAPQAVGKEELDPGINTLVIGEIDHSTTDDTAPASLNQEVDESEFHFIAIEGDVSSSKSQNPSPENGSPIKVEPLLSSIEVNQNEISWNNSLRFSGNTLKPRENDVNYKVAGDGGCVYVANGDVDEIWDVPLTLPNGSRVEVLRMYYYDMDEASTMYGLFTKYDLYGNISQEWSVPSLTGGYNYSDVVISPTQTIDYTYYSYVINWHPHASGTNNQLCGFRVFYTGVGYNFIPMINKR